MNEKQFVYDEKLDVILYYDGGNRFQLEVHNLKDVTVTLNTLQSRIELLEDNCLADNLTRKHLEGIMDKQQATITQLEKVNGKNFAKRRLLERDNLVLRNENEQLRKELKELENNYKDLLYDGGFDE